MAASKAGRLRGIKFILDVFIQGREFMAVLKAGSKGKDVTAAQKLLNKTGAKPKLKEDGIFGDLTDKQTRLFQKKAKLGVDGKIGANTLAALNFGGELPILPELYYKEEVLRDAKHGAYAATLSKSINKAISQFETKMTLIDKKLSETKKALELEVKDGDKRTDIAKKLAVQIDIFEKSKTSDPAKAKKAVPQIDSLYKKWHDIYLNGGAGDWRGKSFDVAIKELESSLAALKDV